MNQIEIAKLIISQNGRCEGVRCEDCQAYIYTSLRLDSCNFLFGGTDDEKCKKWFENWLKENDKIQMTEEQARHGFRRIIPFGFVKTLDEEMFFESFITNMKNAGYIIKSELQQKVEEAEEMYHDKIKERNNFEYASKYSISQIVDKQNEAIQLLKQSHPEFKEK